MQPLYAHSDPHNPTLLPEAPGARWQPLDRHLVHVAHRARHFARQARPGDEAFARQAAWLGLLHDAGKARTAFQNRLRAMASGRKSEAAPHSVYGAALAQAAEAMELIQPILGHHTGLHAWRDLKNKIKPIEQTEAKAIFETLKQNPRLARLLQPQLPSGKIALADIQRHEVSIRMLLSCLVDADRSDCYRFEHGSWPFSRQLEAVKLLDRLLQELRKKSDEMPPGVVKDSRAAVLETCLSQANLPGGLFSLTVPTGGGKTLASMAFALQRATMRPNDFRRIICVIPFLSIIEQNAKVYSEIFGPDWVLEHHSGVNEEDPTAPAEQANREDEMDQQPDRRAHRLATENWDAPLIVTTSVRFFESLFANRPSDVRRIHNIARSIVILDEVQTVPRELLAPLLSMIKEFSDRWGTTFIFCTATQPAFEKPDDAPVDDPRWPMGTIQPIIPEALETRLFHDLKRVQDPIWPSKDEPTSWPQLATELLKERQALCILNTKRHVREVYEEVARQAAEIEDFDIQTSLFHLSTWMCPIHRLKKLDQIRRNLERGRPCIAVSSQLIESGVSLDFPIVFRAIGPLDAIVQAAGRCDREGKLTAQQGKPAGRLIVFEPSEDQSPYPEATAITRALLRLGQLSIHDRRHLRRYFNDYYQDSDLDPRVVQGLRQNLDYPQVNHKFRIITDQTVPVLVAYDDFARELIETLRHDRRLKREDWRKLQRYQISLRYGGRSFQKSEFEEARRKGSIIELWSGGNIWEVQQGCYSEERGLIANLSGAEFA